MLTFSRLAVRVTVLPVLLMLTLFGCATPTPHPPVTSTPPPTIPKATEPSLATATPAPAAVGPTPSPARPTPRRDLTQRPLVWFAPLPPMPTREGRPFVGSEDFGDLFTPDALWVNAAKQVHVFKLYGEWLGNYATDGEVERVVADLNRRGIAIAVEAGPLVPTVNCGQGIEGFVGPEEGLRLAHRIQAAGGNLRFVALDQPFAFGHLYSGPNTCRWPAEKIAQQVADYVRAIHTVFPDAVIGDIEPLWQGAGADEFKNWLETYRAVAGAPLSFLHFDIDWMRPGWPQIARELETFARAQGTEFGMIYNGNWEDASDVAWLARAEERMGIYEAQTGGRPDHVVFQSWRDHPDHLLPETGPATFTHLINRYFRTRTGLTLDIAPASAVGERQASGTLADAGGAPVAGGQVDFTVTPLDGPGVFAEYTASGMPADAAQAVVGFRVNTECGCSGISDFALYGVRYIEAATAANRVPNANFSAGLDNWGFWGEGTARLEHSDRGSGRMLHVAATAGQTAAINSASFPVRAGQIYTLTFAARASPASVAGKPPSLNHRNRL